MSEKPQPIPEQDNPTASSSNPVGVFQVATSTATRNFQNTQNRASSSNPVGIFQVATSTATRNFQNIDKFIWCRDYASDIIVALKESERRRLTLDYKSQQISFRPSLLLLMKTATDTLSFSRTTLHLAVYLLDCFMDSYTIVMEKLNASALMCLLIAAKIEEIDKNVPKLSKFNELVCNVYATRDFKPVEIKILEAVDFDLMCPTIASYVEIYSNQLVSFEDFLRYNARRSAEQTEAYSSYEAMAVETSALLFSVSNVSLHDHRLVNHTPSVVGAACLAAARSIKKVEPLWTERLVNLTGYDFVTITPYMEALESLYAMYARKEVICESPDSGIASDSKSESEGDDCDLEMCHHYQPALKRRKIFN